MIERHRYEIEYAMKYKDHPLPSASGTRQLKIVLECAARLTDTEVDRVREVFNKQFNTKRDSNTKFEVSNIKYLGRFETNPEQPLINIYGAWNE